MISSGTTAISTSSDTAVTVFDTDYTIVRQVTIINEGSVAGFFSIDNGNTWARLPANYSVTLDLKASPRALVCKVKRVASGSDLASIYGFAE